MPVITSYSIHYTKLYDVRISREMQDKGIDAQLIEHYIDAADPQWLEVLKRVRRKKFGDRITSYNVCYTKLLR